MFVLPSPSRSAKGKSVATRDSTLGPDGYTEPDTATRRLVLQRDGYACVCCGVPFLGKRYSVHHRMHKSQGGTNSPSNLIMVLGTCAERIRSHRDLRDEESGYSLRTDQDPELVPILLYGRIGVWLAPDGLYRCEPPQPSPLTFPANSSTTPAPATSLTTAAVASWVPTGARNVRRTLSGRRITLPPFAGSVTQAMKNKAQGLSRCHAPGARGRLADDLGALMVASVNVIVRVPLQRRGDRRLRDLLPLGSFLKRRETCDVHFDGPVRMPSASDHPSVPRSSHARIRESLTSRAWQAPSRRVSSVPRHRRGRKCRRGGDVFTFEADRGEWEPGGSGAHRLSGFSPHFPDRGSPVPRCAAAGWCLLRRSGE